MTGLSEILRIELTQVLLNCQQFDTSQSLKAIFIDGRIYAWRNNLPEANNPSDRVNQIISFLYEQHNLALQKNGLVLFLQVLSEQFDTDDKRHHELIVLSQKLSETITLHPPHFNNENTTNISGDNPLTLPEQDYRQKFLKRIYKIWIEGSLERSFANEAHIALDLTESSKDVEIYIHKLYQEFNKEPQPIPTDTLIVHVFKELANDALLILGEPGAGKTTLLLELGRDLIHYAQNNEGYGIPVILNLSPWAKERKPLIDWLALEINRFYELSLEYSKKWVSENRFILLLDGLDEVAVKYQYDCLQEINKYRQEHGFVPIVVCSRTNDYKRLNQKLQLHSAIIIQPLSLEQIKSSLPNDKEEFRKIRLALDNDILLQKFTETPLMLNMIKFVYANTPIDTLTIPSNLQDYRKELFERYIKHVLQERREKTDDYTYEQTRYWSTWLAMQMVKHSQTNFFLEWLQPDWLPTNKAFILYNIVDRINSALFSGLFLSLTFGFTIYMYGLLSSPDEVYYNNFWRDIIQYGLLGATIGGLFGGHNEESFILESKKIQSVFNGSINWLMGGIILWLIGYITTQSPQEAIFFAIAGSAMGLLTNIPNLQPRTINIVEVLRWSSTETLRLMPSRIMAGVFFGIIFYLFLGDVHGLIGNIIHGISSHIISGAILGLLISFIFGTMKEVLPEKTIPNQGIRWSAKNAAWAGFQGGGIGAVFAILVTSGPVSWLIFFFLGALISALAFGGYTYLSHYSIRFMLLRYGKAPWDYVKFLDYCDKHSLMRKLGGGYIFIHRQILEYLASESLETTPNLNLKPNNKTMLFSILFGIILLSLISLRIHLTSSHEKDFLPHDAEIVIEAAQTEESGTKIYHPVAIKVGDIVSIKATGKILIGAFDGYVNPDGIERGFMGLPTGVNTDLMGILPIGHKVKHINTYPEGSLLCKISNDTEWHKCGSKQEFKAQSNGYLEFLVNHIGGAKAGSFYINVSITK